MASVHLLNILVHIGAGALALGLGVIMLMRRKGTAVHRRWGRVFYWLGGTVVATAALGALLFRPDVALGSITLLVGYLLVSGWRALKLRGARPGALEVLFSLAALATAVWLIVAVAAGEPTIWKPAVTRPIAGGLIFWSLYDLSRQILPRRWFARIWKLEHGVKLFNVIGGLASAAAGTVLADFKPWSQVGPSAVFVVWILLYLGFHGRRHLTPVA